MKKRPKFKPIYDPKYLNGVGACKPMKVFKFTWDWCPLCQTMFVRCPKCGNNCCNASFGAWTAEDKPSIAGCKDAKVVCDVCNLAYQYQDLAWKHKDHPKPTKKQLRSKSHELDFLK